MSKILKKSSIVIAGLAVFSMLFGSGNIVFPIMIGKDFAGKYPIAILGWLLTAAVVPVAGYFGSLLFDGNNKKFLSPIGKHLALVLMILLMSIAGPFGVIARGVNVAYGGLHVVSPLMSEFWFNLVYCVIMVLLSWFPGKLVHIIGVIFTPLKFGGVAIVILGALYFGESIFNIKGSEVSAAKCFVESAKTGFQTMDLLAAFLMSSVMFTYIKKVLPENSRKLEFMKFAAWVCIIATIMLGIVYIGLVLIGAQYSVQLQETPNESLFASIAMLSMGSGASWFVAIVMAVCCMATDIALSVVFTDFVHDEVLKGKYLGKKPILILTGVVTFIASLVGFDEICNFLGTILNGIYPLLIIFVFARMFYFFKTNRNLE